MVLCACGCDGSPARFAVLVPYTTRQGARGADWLPFARRCLPSGEPWPVRKLLPVLA